MNQGYLEPEMMYVVVGFSVVVLAVFGVAPLIRCIRSRLKK